MVNNQTTPQSSPRFLVAGKECIYKLFDAFIKKTVIEDSTIDFSKPVVVAEDGSFEFADGGRHFSEIVGSIKVKNGNAEGAALPMRGRNEPDYDYAKRVAKWRKAQKKEQGQLKAVDGVTLAKDATAVDKYNSALDNYLSGMETAVSEEISVEVMEIVDGLAKEGSKRTAKPVMMVTKEAMDDMNLAAAHLNWLWSLGMDGRHTNCGKFGEAASIGENWTEGLEGYEDKDGLWNAKSVGTKKDLLLMRSIFYRFMTWPYKPEFKTVEEVKAAFIEYIFKTKKDCEALVRNGLLHFCNPDKYINIYSYEKKAAYVQSHSDLLEGYVVSDYSELRAQDSLFFSMRFKKEADCAPYQANRTEEKICYIYDKLRSRIAG